MPIKSETIPCNFVGVFKVGDNLVFNARILSKLAAANDAGIFNKLIVLQVGSMLEAALAQIIYRAQNFNREGVPNISEADRAAIEGKEVDKFNTVIDVLRKYKVLDPLGAGIYDDLHKLRKYRNKIHIQNSIGIAGVSADEDVAFSNALSTWALSLNVNILRYLSEHCSRPEELGRFVNDLMIPNSEPAVRVS